MRNDRINFLEVLFGAHFQPAQITEDLFSKEPPPFVLTLFLCILLTLLVPVITQAAYLNTIDYHWDRVVSALIFVTLSIIFFSVVELFTLWFLGVRARIDQIVAAISYTFPPLLNALWLLFIWNYFENGSITIVTRYVTGYATVAPWIEFSLPYILAAANFSGFLIFSYCLHAIGGLHIVTALFTSLLSLIPLYISVILAIFVAEQIVPGTASNLSNIIEWPTVINWFFEKVSLQALS